MAAPFGSSIKTARTRDQTLLKGKWSAVFFGYTFCPDECPTTLTTLAQAQARLGRDSANFQVVFITIDPARDKPAQLKSYLANPSFPKGTIGLTGTDAQVAGAARAWKVYYKKVGHGPDYAMDHTAVVYLMDPDGHFSRPLGGGTGPEVAREIQAAMQGV